MFFSVLQSTQLCELTNTDID